MPCYMGMSTGLQMVGNYIMHHTFFFTFTIFSLFPLHLCYSIFISVTKLLSQSINFTIFQILPILLGLGRWDVSGQLCGT